MNAWAKPNEAIIAEFPDRGGGGGGGDWSRYQWQQTTA